ncbi:glycosyltransferase [Runella slithyformis]|uniref:Glycosyltransferase 28 domain protein n=1 Tax=Runella slithyformis (strain ATCC 29530 / DSM 19594 / LMG 11500 / NCIMB 11436 / LSU 4) TaxID=761193 RepID=A0A7U3ZHR5_RUNSL|nr:glycosyltransferase [Runella slithyformis]AEI47362.1 Glycosyltransferase 28 domain protein [Runella slithyformis DSM 19594]
MKDNIIFISAPIKSHIIPSFYIANLLSIEFNIYYIVTDVYFVPLIEKNNYKVILSSGYRPLLGMEKAFICKNKKKGTFNHLLSIINQDVDKFRKKEFKEIYKKLNPKAVFIDMFSSTDYVLLHGLEKKNLFFFNPMPSTYRIHGFPVVSEPDFLNKYYDVSRNPLKSTKISLKNLIKKPKNTLLLLLQFLFARKTLKDNGLSEKIIADNNEYTVGFKGVPEFLLIPIEFEFSEKIKLPWQNYLGLSINEKPIYEDLDIEYYEDWTEIVQIKKPIIYCSFGTFYSGPEDKLFNFIEKLIDVRKELDLTFIISTNSQNLKNRIKKKAINSFYVYNKVPQLQVLKKASIYICHGGMGSIKESIFYGVPLLVYPLDLNYDQSGNGLKVVYHEIGLRGDFIFDNANDIIEKIKELLNNNKYSQKIKKLQKQINTSYNDNKNRELIKSFFK